MESPSYYAIIPANVRYAKIKPNAKLLYGEITALADKTGFCWAGNRYFSELYGVTEKQITVWISELVKFGFIASEIRQDEGNKRYLSLNQKVPTYPPKGADPTHQKVGTYNTTSINTTYNTTSNTPTPKGDLESDHLLKRFHEESLATGIENRNVTQHMAVCFFDLGYVPAKDETAESLRTWIVDIAKLKSKTAEEMIDTINAWHAYWKGNKKPVKNHKASLLNHYSLKAGK